MSRVRKEAKILKNFRRECEWGEFITEEGEPFIYPISRYKPARLDIAHHRLVKAMRRRYRNAARKAWKEDGDCSMYRYNNHKACSYEVIQDAYEWWNIPD